MKTAQGTQSSGTSLAVGERPCARKGTANAAGKAPAAAGLPGGPGAPLLRHLDCGAAAPELRAGQVSCPGGGKPPSRGATRSGFQPSFYHPAYKHRATEWTGGAPSANWRGCSAAQTPVRPARGGTELPEARAASQPSRARSGGSAAPAALPHHGTGRDCPTPAAAPRQPRPPAAFAPQLLRAAGRGKRTCRTAQGILALQNASVLRPAELSLGFPNELYHLDHLGQVPGQGPLLITGQAAHGKGHRLFPRPPPPARLCRGEEALQHRHPGPRPPPGSRSHPPARAAAMGIQSGARAPGCPPPLPLARGGPGPAEGRSSGLRRPRSAPAAARPQPAARRLQPRRSGCRAGAGPPLMPARRRDPGAGARAAAHGTGAGGTGGGRSSRPAKRRGGGTLTLSLPWCHGRAPAGPPSSSPSWLRSQWGFWPLSQTPPSPRLPFGGRKGGDSRDAARAGSGARVRWRRAVPPPAPLSPARPGPRRGRGGAGASGVREERVAGRRV